MQSFWMKYLPVIRILLKKALNEEQTLQLDVTDFERAGLSRKAGYKFLLKIKNAKLDNIGANTPLAANLVSQLQQDAAARELLTDREYHIGLSQKALLSIKYVPVMEHADHE